MEERKMFFEEVPIEVAMRVAEQEAGRNGNGPVQRPWRDIAREMTGEQDPHRLMELAGELTSALDAERSRQTDRFVDRKSPKQD